MAGKVTICFTGLTSHDGKYRPGDYVKMVQALGCNFSHDLDLQTVDYLVVGKAGMDKHLAAMKHGIRCVTENWLIDSYHSKLLLPVDGVGDAVNLTNTSTPISSVALPINYIPLPLHGLLVTLTNVSSADKRILTPAISELGCCYYSNVERADIKKFTHCITDPSRLASANTSSASDAAVSYSNMDKLYAFVEYNEEMKKIGRIDKQVKIVSIEWLYVCIKEQKWISEVNYLIPLDTIMHISTSSVDNKSSTSDSVSLTNEGIHNSDYNESVPSHPVDNDEDDEHEEDKKQSEMKNQQALKKFYFNDFSYEELPVLQLPSESCDSNSNNSNSSIMNNAPLQSNSKSRPFQKHIFYICGFQDLRSVDYIIRCIILGGGCRSIVFTRDVTHVVIGPHADVKSIQMMKQHPLSPPISIHVYYLLESLLSHGILSNIDYKREYHNYGPDLLQQSQLLTQSRTLHDNDSSGNNTAFEVRQIATTRVVPATDSVSTSTSTNTSKISNSRYIKSINDLAQQSRVKVAMDSLKKNTSDATNGTIKRKFGL